MGTPTPVVRTGTPSLNGSPENGAPSPFHGHSPAESPHSASPRDLTTFPEVEGEDLTTPLEFESENMTTPLELGGKETTPPELEDLTTPPEFGGGGLSSDEESLDGLRIVEPDES